MGIRNVVNTENQNIVGKNIWQNNRGHNLPFLLLDS